MIAGSSIRPLKKAQYGLSCGPGRGVKPAPNASRLRTPAAPGISASPELATPQLRCNAVCRSRNRPAAAMIRSSYQRRVSIGAGTCTRPPPASRTAPSAATDRVSPFSIASTVCGRPSSNQGCTRTTIVHGSGSAIGAAAVTMPHEPECTGWKRELYSPANAAGSSSSFMPGPAGLASPWMMRTRSARYGAVELAGDLDRDALAGPGREAVEIADQRNYHAQTCL